MKDKFLNLYCVIHKDGEKLFLPLDSIRVKPDMRGSIPAMSSALSHGWEMENLNQVFSVRYENEVYESGYKA